MSSSLLRRIFGYCTMELAALSAVHDQVKALGASLVGISPQAPETRIRCVDPDAPFPLLFDAGAKLARRCRIVFALSDELWPSYTRAGYRPLSDGRDKWLLPLAGTYLLDWTGEVAFSYVDSNWTSRLEPTDIITILAHLARRMDRERLHRVPRASSKSLTRISYGTSQPPDQQHDASGTEERCSGSDRCLEVLGEPAVSIDPGEEPFHHPSAWQHLETHLIRQFADNLHADGCGVRELLTGINAVGEHLLNEGEAG